MNSLKRERQDSEISSHSRVIRSHRRREPSSFFGFAVLVLATALTSGLSIVVVHAATPMPSLPAVHAFSVPQVATESAESGTLGEGVPDKVADAQDRDKAARGLAAIKAYELHMTQQRRADQIEMVIKFALAQQGKRYVFGAAGPSVYDCSGLVLAAFHQIGIELYHYTGVMLGKGTAVGQGALQRGDIIFPSYSHVAIYLGSGMQVAASSGQGKVIVQKVYAFYAARRLL